MAQPLTFLTPGREQRFFGGIALPDGWEASRDLDDGLVQLSRFDLKFGKFDYAVAAVGTDGTLRLCHLPTEGDALSAGFRFQEGYLVSSRRGAGFYLDANMNLLRMDPLTEAPLCYESLGHVVALKTERKFQFLNKDDGRQLSSIDIPPGKYLHVARATREKIVVAVHSHPANHSDGREITEVRTWAPGTGWHAAVLHGVTHELFAGENSG